MGKNKYLLSAEYINELLKWSSKTNLMSQKDRGKIVSRHFLDSFKVFNKMPDSAKVMDIGSGNGFPSVPMAIFRDDIKVFAFESQNKKTAFLNNVKNKLNLNNYIVINKRIELKINELKNYFNIIIARAFGNVKSIVEKTLFYTESNAIYLIYKEVNTHEKDAASNNHHLIHNVDKYVYKLPDGIRRVITSFKIVKKE